VVHVLMNEEQRPINVQSRVSVALCLSGTGSTNASNGGGVTVLEAWIISLSTVALRQNTVGAEYSQSGDCLDLKLPRVGRV